MPESVDSLLKISAEKNGGILSFRDFSEIALFAPRVGYYSRQRQRVGFGAGTDFYTASEVGEIFGTLVAAAAATMLGQNADPKEFSFVEIGAEPGKDNLAAARQIFAEAKAIRLGEKIEIPEKAVVFANELFDAQPFHRLVFAGGEWREIGVATDPATGQWREKILPRISTEKLREFIATNLPQQNDDGWHLDISLDAETLLEKILATTVWRGAIVFHDYGKTLADCMESFPAGTARAYFRHTLSNDLTTNPGEQDLTCHVLWDRLSGVAKKCGFADARVRRQEAFFMEHALAEIGKIVAHDGGERSVETMRRRNKLMELIHPAKMGHAFQVLAGTRGI